MTLGSEISLNHPTPVGLVWCEFWGLNLDQWVLGNSQVSILDQSLTLGSEISLNHPTPVGLVWREFGGLNLDQWVLGNGRVSILYHFRCGLNAPEAKPLL